MVDLNRGKNLVEKSAWHNNIGAFSILYNRETL